MNEVLEPTPSKRALRAAQLTSRYGVDPRTIKRWKDTGVLPPPDLTINGDTVNNLGDVAVPPAFAAEMAALLLPDVREAIKNLKRLEAALTKIVGESMGTSQ